MPGKYSHSQVLIDYESRGIISLPHDQYAKYMSSVPSRPTSRATTSHRFRNESTQTNSVRAASATGYSNVYGAANQSSRSLAASPASTKPRKFINTDDDAELIVRGTVRSAASHHQLNGNIHRARTPTSPRWDESPSSFRKDEDASSGKLSSQLDEAIAHLTSVHQVITMAPLKKTQPSAEQLTSLPGRNGAAANQVVVEKASIPAKSLPSTNGMPQTIPSPKTISRSKPPVGAPPVPSISHLVQDRMQNITNSPSQTLEEPTASRAHRVRKAKQAGFSKYQERAKVKELRVDSRSDSIQTTETQIYDPPQELGEPDFDGFSDVGTPSPNYFDRPVQPSPSSRSENINSFMPGPRKPRSIQPVRSDAGQKDVTGQNVQPPARQSSLIPPAGPNAPNTNQGNNDVGQARSTPIRNAGLHQRTPSNESESSYNPATHKPSRLKPPMKSTQAAHEQGTTSPQKPTTPSREHQTPSRTTATSVTESRNAGSFTSISSVGSVGVAGNTRSPRTNHFPKDQSAQPTNEMRWGLPEIMEDTAFANSIFEGEHFPEPVLNAGQSSGFGQISSGRDVNFDNDDAASDLSAAYPPNISRWREEESGFKPNMPREPVEKERASSKQAMRSETPVSRKGKGFFSRFKLRS